MGKVKEFVEHKEFVAKDGVRRRVLVYGELIEHKEVDAFTLRVKTNYRNEMVDIKPICPLKPMRKTKEFRMGYSICLTDIDQFDIETGIRMAKKRLSVDPLVTINPTLLTKDMCTALIINEIDYIQTHLEKYIPSEEK